MEYLSANQIILINQEIVSVFGEPFAIRDFGALFLIAETVKKKFNFENKKDAIANKAAFLIWEITDRHIFAEGNKRTGLIAGLTFLKINGFTLNPKKLNQEKLSELEWAVAKKEIRIKRLVKIIKESLS
ncbi:MAG: type II toxin-antitoxin system death-on-curing family toxin [Candidatus ainarchaeum sp.]|nr:type II toxin-antitoxin system death-on-curing family toxin [Candidatus ainarchaeum sp.]